MNKGNRKRYKKKKEHKGGLKQKEMKKLGNLRGKRFPKKIQEKDKQNEEEGLVYTNECVSTIIHNVQ